MTAHSECSKCEELLQPYVDRSLTEAERLTVQTHLAACSRCTRCYKLEEVLWKHVRNCCDEQAGIEFASGDLKDRLADLRTPLI
jgi:hypothetical protein